MIGLLLLCTLPFVLTFPSEHLDHLVHDYSQDIENLKRTARDIKFIDSDGDVVKIIKSEPLIDPAEYDFIIVGAGSAGSVLANRLSEVPEWKILLLEAGKPESKVSRIPGIAELLQLSEYNWGYHMEPQEKACLGMVNHQCLAPRGKALGGTSSINSMLYTRGNSLDYDRWADEGPKGWCYNDVLPYFKKSEDVSITHFDNKYHNKGGLMSVEDVQHRTGLTDVFLSAVKELGYKVIDYNGHDQMGFGVAQVTTRRGKRESTGSAFLDTAFKRKNLKILPLSHVTKIHIGEHTNEVKGVEYVHEGKLHVSKAKKEVILSAGPIASPQILMLSGVGPKEDLEKLEIPCKVDLPVGHNLQDHMTFMGLNFLVNATVGESSSENDLKEWLLEGKGPLSGSGIEGLGYIKTKHSKESKPYPDIELVFVSKTITKDGNHYYSKTTGISDETYHNIFEPLEGHKVWAIYPLLMHPKSVGKISLKSKNPFQWPRIESNYFTDKDGDDVHTMVEGIKAAIAFCNSPSFQAHDCKLPKTVVPGCESYEHGSDDYWACAVKHISRSVHHQVGTCRMGVLGDNKSVVDEHLNVFGIKGLRVADSSVIPFSITAHTNAPAVMIGEKAADIIKETWK